MPKTTKPAAEEAAAQIVEAVAAAEPAAEAPAEKPAEKPARKPRAKKAAEKKPAEKKPAAKKAPAKKAEKKAEAPKAAPARGRKAKIATKVVVELADRNATPDELVERAKTDWANKGNSVDDIKELAIYVNAAEGTVYYVVNDDYLSGSFDF